MPRHQHHRSAQSQRGRQGRPLAPRHRGRALSVLSTSVTNQTGDMVYSGARRLRILSIWAHTTMLYALERDSDHGSTLQPEMVWPAASTFGNILSRAGLTSPQRKRKRTTPCSEPFSMVTGPNQLWCMAFKGYFVTSDGKRCDPFTITDAYSRYLIRCQIVSRMDLSQVRAICEAAMREYGVPARIRTDNGAPFAGTGLPGPSKLSLGWMKLGIVHERIQAGRPQQNGCHERMHRTCLAKWLALFAGIPVVPSRPKRPPRGETSGALSSDRTSAA
jgi:transposase InsO family protein